MSGPGNRRIPSPCCCEPSLCTCERARDYFLDVELLTTLEQSGGPSSAALPAWQEAYDICNSISGGPYSDFPAFNLATPVTASLSTTNCQTVAGQDTGTAPAGDGWYYDYRCQALPPNPAWYGIWGGGLLPDQNVRCTASIYFYCNADGDYKYRLEISTSYNYIDVGYGPIGDLVGVNWTAKTVLGPSPRTTYTMNGSTAASGADVVFSIFGPWTNRTYYRAILTSTTWVDENDTTVSQWTPNPRIDPTAWTESGDAEVRV